MVNGRVGKIRPFNTDLLYLTCCSTPVGLKLSRALLRVTVALNLCGACSFVTTDYKVPPGGRAEVKLWLTCEKLGQFRLPVTIEIKVNLKPHRRIKVNLYVIGQGTLYGSAHPPPLFDTHQL